MAFHRETLKTYESRRVRRNGRVVILPPEGYGDQWVGSQLLSETEIYLRDTANAAKNGA